MAARHLEELLLFQSLFSSSHLVRKVHSKILIVSCMGNSYSRDIALVIQYGVTAMYLQSSCAAVSLTVMPTKLYPLTYSI